MNCAHAWDEARSPMINYSLLGTESHMLRGRSRRRSMPTALTVWASDTLRNIALSRALDAARNNRSNVSLLHIYTGWRSEWRRSDPVAGCSCAKMNPTVLCRKQRLAARRTDPTSRYGPVARARRGETSVAADPFGFTGLVRERTLHGAAASQRPYWKQTNEKNGRQDDSGSPSCSRNASGRSDVLEP
jgi:hypothetical protein